MQSKRRKNPLLDVYVMWILWAALLLLSFLNYYFLHDQIVLAADQLQTWHVIAPVAVSLILRWLVLPRMRVIQNALIVMVIGIAFAEGAIWQIIYLPTTRRLGVFIVAILAIALHAPLYAKRLVTPAPDHENC